MTVYTSEVAEINHADCRMTVRAIVEQGAITYTSIARESGLSGTALSQFMNDNYKGDNAAVENKLKMWLENRQRKAEEMPNAPTFVETQTARQIWNALQYAQMAECITVIYGIPGVGKSQALQQFVKARANCWLISAAPSRASLSECLYELAGELGINDAPRHSGRLGQEIRRKLKGTHGLIIIDEADHLEYAVLEELRIVQEETGVGLAFVGNHRVYAKMTGGNSRTMDFARLFSRIAKTVAILETKQEDVTAIADAWELGKAEREIINAISQRPGALRVVTHTLRLAAMLAQGSSEPLSEKHIRAAVKDLEGVTS